MTGTAVATRTEPKAALVTGGEVAAIIPRNIEEMFRLAGAIHASGLAPNTLKGPDQIMVAIMAGAELGLAPFQSLQSFAVINGRPSIWGDGLMAVVRSQGFKVREWIDGEGDNMVARCEVTRPDSGEVAPGSFSVADAKKAGLWGKAGPWQSYPKRMLQMRARAFSLRDGAADVLRGFQIREEVEDYQHVREVTGPEKAGVMARLQQHGTAGSPGFAGGNVDAGTSRPLAPEIVDAILDNDHLPPHDPHTGEITDAIIDPPADDGLPVRDDTDPSEFPGDQQSTTTREASGDNPGAGGLTLTTRVDAYLARIGEAKTTIKMKAIRAASEQLRKELDMSDPERLVAVEEAFNAKFADLEEAEKAGRA